MFKHWRGEKEKHKVLIESQLYVSLGLTGSAYMYMALILMAQTHKTSANVHALFGSSSVYIYNVLFQQHQRSEIIIMKKNQRLAYS